MDRTTYATKQPNKSNQPMLIRDLAGRLDVYLSYLDFVDSTKCIATMLILELPLQPSNRQTQNSKTIHNNLSKLMTDNHNLDINTKETWIQSKV